MRKPSVSNCTDKPDSDVPEVVLRLTGAASAANVPELIEAAANAVYGFLGPEPKLRPASRRQSDCADRCQPLQPP